MVYSRDERYHGNRLGWCGPRAELYDAFVAAGDVVRRKGTVISEQDLISEFGGSFRDSEGNLPYGTEVCTYQAWRFCR